MLKTVSRRILAIPTPVLFIVSLLVAILLLWQQNALDEIGPAIRGADLWILVAGFLIYLAGLALLCARWHVLVSMVQGSSNFLRASEAFVTSVAVNYAAPLSLALPSRAYLTKRALGLGTAEIASITFWEVAADLVVLGTASVFWVIVGGWRGEGISIDSSLAIVVALSIILAVTGCALAIRRSRRIRNMVVFAKRHLTSVLRYPARRPGKTAAAIAITVIYWTLQGVVIWLLLRAIDGVSPNSTLVLGLVSLPILIGMLSPVPGGAGVREALMIAVASVHGANEASVLLAGVTYRSALFAAIPVLYGLIRIGIGVSNRGHGRMPRGDSAAVE